MIDDAPEQTIAVADIGGTHARFALARVSRDGRPQLGEIVVFKAADYPDLASAFKAFTEKLDGAPPRRGSFALACPIRGDVLKFTNSPWVVHPATLAKEIGLDHVLLLNDFGAVAHAIAKAELSDFAQVCGPQRPPPDKGVLSILGPGTGLGVAQLIRDGANYRVNETEGGHIGFAPVDAFEDKLLATLREKFGRVSVERVLSGPGLEDIYAAIHESEPGANDAGLWAAAISGEDPAARAALEKFCQCYGSVAGDIALVHGAHAVILAGGLSPRIAPMLTKLGFHQRFVDKGRYRAMLEEIPVWLVTHPQPGLFGAAAAFRA